MFRWDLGLRLSAVILAQWNSRVHIALAGDSFWIRTELVQLSVQIFYEPAIAKMLLVLPEKSVILVKRSGSKQTLQVASN